MEVYERIFARLEELGMSQIELSRRTGIATSTISDWRKKKMNPQTDKLVPICKALGMSLVDLLCDEEDKQDAVLTGDYLIANKIFMEKILNSSADTKKRIIGYIEMLLSLEKRNRIKEKNVSIIEDINGKNIVIINGIKFRGRQSIDWKSVREYLKKYVGEYFIIASTGDVVYIGSDLPKEFTGSVYTKSLKGTNAKAKANAATALPELIEIATDRQFKSNTEEKHNWNARKGWYRYRCRFALPIYNDNEEVERFNVFRASMLVRHSNDGKMYLYDIIDIKKETSGPLES